MSKFVSSFTLAEVTAAERTSARALGTSSRPGLQLVIKAASTITPAASRQLIVLFMYRYIRNFNYSSEISIILQDFKDFRDFKEFNCRFLSSFCSLSVQGLGQGLGPGVFAGGLGRGLEPRVFAGGLAEGFRRRLGPRVFAGGLSRGLGRGFRRGLGRGFASDIKSLHLQRQK